MNVIKNSLASVALAGLLIAQPVSAATRSSDSLPSTGIQQPLDVERTGAAITASEDMRGQSSKALIILLAFGGILGLMIALGAIGGGNDSPG